MEPGHFLLWITSPSQATIEQARLREIASDCGFQVMAPTGANDAAATPLTEPEPSTLLVLPLIGGDGRNPEGVSRELKTRLLATHPAPYAFSIQESAVRVADKRLICFDMDSTLIRQEVIDEMARAFGFHDEVAAITEQAMQGKLDFRSALKARVALFRGLPQARALGILPMLAPSPGAEALLAHARSKRMQTVVVSGGFDFILEPFQRSLHLDAVYGNSLPVTPSGEFDGTVSEPILDAPGKRQRLHECKERGRIGTNETIAVGDGANDTLMMAEAGISVSFCGKAALREACNTFVFDRNLLWIKALL
jgi:phosphoserine phosphatase